ncbi:MAG: DUF4837 domain-containing protein [Bacteroidetes bacterium CG12_big_fil_rev_8_21_14_0_65_60_17]|nr:MAG: DUF4837 domain-containing protein [Bacteroidetes bacterium CG12_big_fil_rev_8_21_14_0_65_60_17]
MPQSTRTPSTMTTDPQPGIPRHLLAGVLLLCGAVMLQAGCESLEYRPMAAGREGEIIVVMDSARWGGPVGDAVREHVAPYLGTLPAPEREFGLRRLSMTGQGALDAIRAQKNVLIVAPLSDNTDEARFLKARLDSSSIAAVMGGDTAIISRRDLWRQRQQVMYVLGATDDDLVRALESQGEDVRYQFNTITRERMTREMFEKGRQPDLEQQMLDKHGFAVNMQHDWFTAIDTTLSDSTGFIWLRRVVSSESWRSLFLYYVDDFNPANLTPEWVQAARDRLSETWIHGNAGGYTTTDYRRDLTSENIDFKGRFAYETRGLWHMVFRDDDGEVKPFGMGGPFLNYTFYDEDTGRLYMLDGTVFAPGYDKREFLRQLEVISHTFRTAGDVAHPVP